MKFRHRQEVLQSWPIESTSRERGSHAVVLQYFEPAVVCLVRTGTPSWSACNDMLTHCNAVYSDTSTHYNAD